MEDRLLVENDHSLSSDIRDVSSVSTGKRQWIGNNVAVIDTSSFETDNKITASGALAINLDEKEALWGKDIYKKINVSEVSMLFAVYTALQKSDLEDEITVSEEALQYSSTGCAVLGLQAGDVITVEELLYGMVFNSDVDCANVLAVGISGTVDSFVKEMNADSKEIGCVDTKLKNAAGYYTSGQYTTAYDLYLLINQLMTDQRFVNMMNQTEHELQYNSADGSSCQYQLTYGIKLISQQSGAINNVNPCGGMYGFSSYSGYHLALLSKDNSGNWIFSVVLGAGSESKMNKQMKRILKKIK